MPYNPSVARLKQIVHTETNKPDTEKIGFLNRRKSTRHDAPTINVIIVLIYCSTQK